jgi:hypothetical protein
MRTYTITYAGLGFDVRVARVDDGDLVTVYLAGARLSRTELAEYDASVDDVARSLAAGIAQDFKRASKVESASQGQPSGLRSTATVSAKFASDAL